MAMICFNPIAAGVSVLISHTVKQVTPAIAPGVHYPRYLDRTRSGRMLRRKACSK